MNSSDLIKKLLDIHEKRKQNDPILQGAKFYRFKEPGEKLVGRITGKTRDRFDRERYIVLDLKTEEEYVLPGHKALLNQLGVQNAEPGDYVVVEYLGQSEKGYHRYDVTVIDENEFRELQELEEKTEEIQQEAEKELEKSDEDFELDLELDEDDQTLEELLKENSESTSANSSKENNSKDKSENKSSIEEAAKCLETLFAFHDKLPFSEIDYYLNQVKKLNVDTKKLLEDLGYTIVDNEVIKKEV